MSFSKISEQRLLSTASRDWVASKSAYAEKFLFSKPFWLAVAAGAILLTLIILGIVAFSNNWLFGGGGKDTLIVPNFVGKKYDDLSADNFKEFADVDALLPGPQSGLKLDQREVQIVFALVIVVVRTQVAFGQPSAQPILTRAHPARRHQRRNRTIRHVVDVKLGKARDRRPRFALRIAMRRRRTPRNRHNGNRRQTTIRRRES